MRVKAAGDCRVTASRVTASRRAAYSPNTPGLVGATNGLPGRIGWKLRRLVAALSQLAVSLPAGARTARVRR